MANLPSEPLRVKCPGCGAKVTWHRDNANRPFCSERCKAEDFIAWANEEQVIAGSPECDDVLSSDLQRN